MIGGIVIFIIRRPESPEAVLRKKKMSIKTTTATSVLMSFILPFMSVLAQFYLVISSFMKLPFIVTKCKSSPQSLSSHLRQPYAL